MAAYAATAARGDAGVDAQTTRSGRKVNTLENSHKPMHKTYIPLFRFDMYTTLVL